MIQITLFINLIVINWLVFSCFVTINYLGDRDTLNFSWVEYPYKTAFCTVSLIKTKKISLDYSALQKSALQFAL